MPARNLRPVPDAPPRALGLVRVSEVGDRDEDHLLSPEIQRAAIEDHCARRGYTITGWIEGIDESGSRRRSAWWAKLDEAVGQVEVGTADVLVVWRFSRAGRQRLKWAVAIDRVEVAGGLLESATEPLDTSTASGRLARGMLAEFAAYEAETIGSAWRETHARRTAKGLPANGKPRFGYRVMDGIHRPDPDEGPVLASLYRRYVAGESLHSLVRWLNTEGILTTPGYSRRGPGPWSTQGLRTMLDSGFGAGLIRVHGEARRGIHEPVIGEATWTAYRAARARRRGSPRTERSRYVLSGLVRCWHVMPDGTVCGSPMGGGTDRRDGHARFRCVAVEQHHAHPGGYVSMRYAEGLVLRWLAEVAAPVETSADAALAHNALRLRRRQDAGRLAREVVELETALTRLTVERATRPDLVPEATYVAARDEMQARKRQLEERALIARADAEEGEPARLAAELLDRWDALDVENRRGMLRRLVRRVEIAPGLPRTHARVVGLWESVD